MDKSKLIEGAKLLGIPLSHDAADRLLAFAQELLKWNKKINLTAITSEDEVIEKHLLDSLLAVRFMPSQGTFLDFGSGAGLPGIPLAVMVPNLNGVLVDSVDKKVAFIKTGAIKAKVSAQVKGHHVFLQGAPEAEGLALVNAVISRAFMDVSRFLPLAKPYVLRGGSVVAMLGPSAVHELQAQALLNQMVLKEFVSFELPFSKEPRAMAVFHVEQ